jgi:hypothetical protein
MERRSRGIDRDSKYDLTPLGEQNTNLAQTRPGATVLIDPYEVTRARDCTS